MDALYVFITTRLAQSWGAGCWSSFDFESTAYGVCDSSSSESDLIDNAEVSRIGRSLWSFVCVWSAGLVSRADVFRHAWKWFMKR